MMSDNQDFELWLAKEKRSFSEQGYSENWATFDRIKTRFGTVVTLSSTLLTATAAASFSGQPYALFCLFLAEGFFVSALCSVVGLYSTGIQTKNIGPHTIDDVLHDMPERTEGNAQLWLAATIYAINVENDKAIARDRLWLQRAWSALVLTPGLALFAALIARLF